MEIEFPLNVGRRNAIVQKKKIPQRQTHCVAGSIYCYYIYFHLMGTQEDQSHSYTTNATSVLGKLKLSSSPGVTCTSCNHRDYLNIMNFFVPESIF